LLGRSVRVLALLELAPDTGEEGIAGTGAERDEAGVSVRRMKARQEDMDGETSKGTEDVRNLSNMKTVSTNNTRQE